MKNKRHLAFHVVEDKTKKTRSDEKLRIHMGLNNNELFYTKTYTEDVVGKKKKKRRKL